RAARCERTAGFDDRSIARGHDAGHHRGDRSAAVERERDRGGRGPVRRRSQAFDDRCGGNTECYTASQVHYRWLPKQRPGAWMDR
ncbi:MAG TPA: hypothetical protein PKA66_00210, partial [Gemmatimonadales bacterium]|nr:hypothetical protein [Gemmatimonadales bacterium]